tara:strand:+ start:21982 stop:22695 length:714 start_codon:yes stop_codon:yes gene_type:complete
MSDLELFPVINPNIEEIIERESAIDGENVSIPEEEERLSHKDIFSGDGEKNVKMSVKEPVVKKPKGNYSHLAEARKKGALTRQKKAEAKRIAKAEAKAKKDEEKRLRREATAERNRVKARERYRREKAKKDEQADLKEKIRLDSQHKKDLQEQEYKRTHYVKRQHPPMQQQGGMSFEKFAGYMMQYEGMKQQFAMQQNQRAKQNKVPEKPKSEFPDNYPLAHLYKKNKNRRADFSNF